MASFRTSGPGPTIKTVVRPMRVNRRNCYRVLMRQMRPGPDHGRWQPISTHGFMVVCCGKLEASELVLMVGGRYFSRPDALAKAAEHDSDDFRYLDWLLEHHLKIEPIPESEVGHFESDGVCRRTLQVRLHTFLAGWYPDAEDVLPGATLVGGVVEPALRARWSGK